MLNKRGRRFALTLGPLIAPDALPADPGEAVQALKAYVEQSLADDPDRGFP
jgi:hypothetical protein